MSKEGVTPVLLSCSLPYLHQQASPDEAQSSFSGVLQLGRTRPVLPSVFAVSEGHGQLCIAISSGPSAVSGATDMSTDHGYSRAMKPDTAYNSRLLPDITIALGGNQPIHLSQLITAFTSSDIPLST